MRTAANRRAANKRSYYKHRDKRLVYMKQYGIANREAILDYKHRRSYGISLVDRDKILASQHYKCAICKTPDPGKKGWCTDHKKLPDGSVYVRGVLCSNCNLLLGHAHDNVRVLCSAVAYLEIP